MPYKYKKALFFSLFYIIYSLPKISTAQSLPFSYELTTNFTSGWWIHNHGSDDATIFNNLGWSRTHFAFMMQGQGMIFHEFPKSAIGIGGTYAWLFDHEMIGPRDRVGFRDRTQISNNDWMEFWQFFVVGQYTLIQKNNFKFQPQLKVGTFDLLTIYPPASNFGFRYFWSLGLTFEFPVFHRFKGIVRPYYGLMTIFPDTPNFNEIHRLYDFGIGVGVRFK